jgi:hypothetical protein
VCCCSVCAGKTTCIVHGMFDQYKAARMNPRAEPYRGVFVTASPTLKEQVQAAFSKYQVRCLALQSLFCPALGSVRMPRRAQHACHSTARQLVSCA